MVDEKGRLEWWDGDNYCRDCKMEIVGQKVITKDWWGLKTITQCIVCHMLENERKYKKKHKIVEPVKEEGYDEDYKIIK